jgi:PST family polysaccharide transporter
MNLTQTSLLAGISNLIKMGSGYIINKALAIYIGPTGIAFVGQFQNFFNISTAIATLGINPGVVKYISQHHENEHYQQTIIAASFIITSTSSILLSVMLLYFHNEISLYLMKSSVYGHVFIFFSLSITCIGFNSLMMEILNGFREIKNYALLTVLTSVINLILIILLVHYFHLKGALLSYIATQIIIFFITVSLTYEHIKETIKNINVFKHIKKDTFIKLFHYSAMTITTNMAINISQLILRNYIEDKISIEHSGYWEGMNRISYSYLGLITMSIIVYYLPHIASIKDEKKLHNEILKVFRLTLPFLALTIFTIYSFRTEIIQILFTNSFAPMEGLFAYQLTGDFFKIAGWLLAFIMIAKSMTAMYITTEIVFYLFYTVSSILLINHFGLKGAAISWALSYITYFIVMLFLFRNIMFMKKK